MTEGGFRVVLTGGLVSGFSHEAVISALARLFESPAGEIAAALDAGDCRVEGPTSADEAQSLQRRLEMIGARARVERAADGPADVADGRPVLRLPRRDDPAEAGLMTCPACGHRQLVAPSCDECGVVFADYRRKPPAADDDLQAVAAAAPPPAPPPVRQRAGAPRPPAAGTRGRSPGGSRVQDIHAAAHAQWRDEWMDDGNEPPTEQYHLRLFMGMQSEHLSEACNRLGRGLRVQFRPTWTGTAVFSPFLWAMYRKMWAWGMVIFVGEILLPVVLITLGSEPGVSNKLVYLGLFLMVASRVFWPAVMKSLYCRHALGTIRYLNRMSPTFAPDIDIATRGGTSRTSAFVGFVVALVASLLTWNIVDTVHTSFASARAAYTAPPPPPEVLEPEQPSTAVPGREEQQLIEENRWVATRSRLRLLGQRVNTWLVGDGRSVDPSQLTITDIAKALTLEAEATVDGWDRPVRFESDGKGYRLVSAGPDGRFGSPDDVEYRRLLER